MAYLRDIPKRQCACGKQASKEVVNRLNATVGFFCAKHAARRLAEMQRLEEATFKATPDQGKEQEKKT